MSFRWIHFFNFIFVLLLNLSKIFSDKREPSFDKKSFFQRSFLWLGSLAMLMPNIQIGSISLTFGYRSVGFFFAFLFVNTILLIIHFVLWKKIVSRENKNLKILLGLMESIFFIFNGFIYQNYLILGLGLINMVFLFYLRKE